MSRKVGLSNFANRKTTEKEVDNFEHKEEISFRIKQQREVALSNTKNFSLKEELGDSEDNFDKSGGIDELNKEIENFNS